MSHSIENAPTYAEWAEQEVQRFKDARERREKLIALGCPVHFVVRQELKSLEEIDAAIAAIPELAKSAAMFREYLGRGIMLVDLSTACGDESPLIGPDGLVTRKAEEASCPKCLERMEKANG